MAIPFYLPVSAEIFSSRLENSFAYRINGGMTEGQQRTEESVTEIRGLMGR